MKTIWSCHTRWFFLPPVHLYIKSKRIYLAKQPILTLVYAPEKGINLPPTLPWYCTHCIGWPWPIQFLVTLNTQPAPIHIYLTPVGLTNPRLYQNPFRISLWARTNIIRLQMDMGRALFFQMYLQLKSDYQTCPNPGDNLKSNLLNGANKSSNELI